jgi:hypothetical protein
VLDRDWASVDITHKRDTREFSDAELLAIATESSDGDPAPPKPKKELH